LLWAVKTAKQTRRSADSVFCSLCFVVTFADAKLIFPFCSLCPTRTKFFLLLLRKSKRYKR